MAIGRGASLNAGSLNAGTPGMTSLALALLSGPCAGGSWCAVVGAPEIGLVAAAHHGVDLERLALVPSPGPRWATVTAALLEGFDVVLLRATSKVNNSDARKLEARARERGSVLAVMGEGWPGPAAVRLEVVAGRWCGLGDGCGHLWGHEVEVLASGRGAASRPQRTRIWFGQRELGVPGPSQREPSQRETSQREPSQREPSRPGLSAPAKLELVTDARAGDAADIEAVTVGIAG